MNARPPLAFSPPAFRDALARVSLGFFTPLVELAP